MRDRLASVFAGAPSVAVLASARPRRASSASARARSACTWNAASASARSRSILVFVSTIVFAVFVVDAAALVDFDVDVDFVAWACFFCLNVALVRCDGVGGRGAATLASFNLASAIVSGGRDDDPNGDADAADVARRAVDENGHEQEAAVLVVAVAAEMLFAQDEFLFSTSSWS